MIVVSRGNYFPYSVRKTLQIERQTDGGITIDENNQRYAIASGEPTQSFTRGGNAVTLRCL